MRSPRHLVFTSLLCLLALLSAAHWAEGAEEIRFGGKKVRVYVLTGADGIVRFTVENLGEGFPNPAICPGSPFSYAVDTNGNGFPDVLPTVPPGYICFPPFCTPPQSSSGTLVDYRVIRRPGQDPTQVGEEGILITIRGADFNLYRTVLDGNCNGKFPIPAFEGSPFFGDPDRDGWPGASSQVPWQRVDP